MSCLSYKDGIIGPEEMLRKFNKEEADFFFGKKSARKYQELFLGAQLSGRNIAARNNLALLIDDPGDFSIILELSNIQ